MALTRRTIDGNVNTAPASVTTQTTVGLNKWTGPMFDFGWVAAAVVVEEATTAGSAHLSLH